MHYECQRLGLALQVRNAATTHIWQVIDAERALRKDELLCKDAEAAVEASQAELTATSEFAQRNQRSARKLEVMLGGEQESAGPETAK